MPASSGVAAAASIYESEAYKRQQALTIAHSTNDNPREVVERANAYLDFLKGGTDEESTEEHAEAEA
jgi:hypothetical protein